MFTACYAANDNEMLQLLKQRFSYWAVSSPKVDGKVVEDGKGKESEKGTLEPAELDKFLGRSGKGQ